MLANLPRGERGGVKTQGEGDHPACTSRRRGRLGTPLAGAGGGTPCTWIKNGRDNASAETALLVEL